MKTRSTKQKLHKQGILELFSSEVNISIQENNHAGALLTEATVIGEKWNVGKLRQ